MQKKDMALIKKIIGSLENTCVTKIASCYVDVLNGNINIMEPEVFLSIPEEEMLQFCSLFKKAVTGQIGSTAIEVKYKKNHLKAVWEDKLKDSDILMAACEEIQGSYHSDDNYCILFASGAWDVPPDREKTDEYEEVYDFLLVTIIPCSLSPSGIIYDQPNNSLINRSKDRALGAPMISFLYPSFDCCHTNIDHVMTIMKNTKLFDQAKNMVKEIFETDLPLSAEAQKEHFHDIIRSGFEGENVSYETLQGVYDHISDLQIDAELSGEDVKLSAEELGEMVVKYGELEGENAEKVRETVKEFQGCEFASSNIAPKKLDIETDVAMIKFDLRDIGEIKKKVVDGIEYYLIPAKHVQIDNMTVK